MYYPNVQQLSLPPLRVIVVTGNAQLSVKPNYAQLRIEVNTEGKDVSVAQQENAIIMNRVISSLTVLNIPREDIQTVAYNIFPNYDYIDGKQVLRGYEVSNVISVKVTDISQVGNVIDTAVQHGANRISSIQFRVENDDSYYQQALRLALQNAQTKAKTIAEKMQLTVHPYPIEIVEENVGQPVLFKSVAISDETPIEQGQIEIGATVRVKFQY